jgi:magnesium transporter
MKGIIRQVGADADASQENIEKTLAGNDFFWLDLDLHDPGPDDDVEGLLCGTFHFHPLAVTAAMKFGQRPRIDNFDDFTHVITFGMSGDGKTVAEIHCFITEKFVVTLHEGKCPALLAVVLQRVRDHRRDTQIPPQVGLLYLVLDSLIDSFFPVMSEMDDAIDDLESAILKNPTEEQLGTLFDMKRQVMTIRKVVAPQRDMIESLNGGMVTIPGMTDTDSIYFRSVYEHTIRITDMVDSYRDLISGAMDTHLSMVSNRLNVIMKQLAIVATFFLPLGFLTGFFGQNFAWLSNHLQSSLPYFLFLGIGSELVAIILLLTMFRRRGWLGSGPTA